MPDPIFNDSAMQAVKFALDGLARRQEVIGNNLSNVDTPGYQAQTLDFESALARMLNHPNGVPLAMTQPGHKIGLSERLGMTMQARNSAAWRADGNDVDIDIELNQMAETGIRYQAVSQLASKKLALLKTIAMSR
jgi:flagellar basal-body rod protein FlgB